MDEKIRKDIDYVIHLLLRMQGKVDEDAKNRSVEMRVIERRFDDLEKRLDRMNENNDKSLPRSRS